MHFVRKVSVILKIAKARSAQRAFCFDLKVTFVGSQPDLLTGFSVSLPQIDALLKATTEELEQKIFHLQSENGGSEILQAVQQILMTLSPRSLQIQGFELNCQENNWGWGSPWNPEQQFETIRAVIRSPEDEFSLKIQTSLLTPQGTVEGYRQALEESFDAMSTSDLDSIPMKAWQLAQDWDFALRQIQIHSGRSGYILIQMFNS